MRDPSLRELASRLESTVIASRATGTTDAYSSVDSAIYGIQWAHNLADVPAPTNSPIVRAISGASKRIIGTRVTNKKEPISPDMIRKLVDFSSLDNLLELRNVCIFLLEYAGFFQN